MADEHAIARYRHWYRQLLRFYSKSYRERFGESMEQTFNDLCRERAAAGEGLFRFVIWTFAETTTAIFNEKATAIMRCTMERDSTLCLKFVKYSAITISVLMLVGIAALMVISRGKGEDITGIVSPALLIAFVSGLVATVVAVFQMRVPKAIDKKSNSDLPVQM